MWFITVLLLLLIACILAGVIFAAGPSRRRPDRTAFITCEIGPADGGAKTRTTPSKRCSVQKRKG